LNAINPTKTKNKRTNAAPNVLKCLYTNATSVCNKWDELASLLVEKNYPHVLAITETWFNSNSLVKINGYTHYLLNRSEGRGGGVVVYIKEDLCSYEVKLLDLSSEQVWCGIDLGCSKLLIGCLYRPPFSDRATNLNINDAINAASKLIEEKKYTDLLIMGDLNHSDIVWSNAGGTFKGAGRASSVEFLETINNNYLSQYVLDPTFGNKILDLVISNKDNNIFNVNVGPPLSCSNKNALHSTLFWDLSIGNNRVSSAKRGKFDYSRANFEDLNNAFAKLDWNLIVDESVDIDMSAKYFLDNYWTVIVQNVPYISYSISNNKAKQSKAKPKWYNSDVNNAIQLKFHLFAKLRASSSSTRRSNARNYNKQARQVKKLVKLARRKYEAEIAAESKKNPKLIYSYIKNQSGGTNVIKSLKDEDGKLLSNPIDIANCLNTVFYKSFTQHDGSALPDFDRRTNESCSVSPNELFSWNIIKDKLDELETNKSSGLDEIHPLVLKNCSKSLCVPLSLLFTKSFKVGALPSCWKFANVTPIFKKGSKNCALNYRPISLTSILCKIMEKIIRDAMIRFLLATGLLSMHQHGFVHAKSCATNLIETLDIITEALNRGFYAIMVLLDFAKAFDTVCHEFLKLKLRAYGFDGYIYNWISDFLANRKQRVVIGDSYSQWFDVTSGVPQGSVLGPLLFVIFINDMPQLTSHFCKLFADDSKLIGVIKNSQDKFKLQQDIDTLVDWSNKWRMCFNISKCKVLEIKSNRILRNQNEQYELSMADATGSRFELAKTNSEKDLGVVLNNKLKWNDHIDQSILKANAAMGMLKRTFKFWNCSIFKQLYTTMVRPHLEYCSSVWNPHLKKDISKLEKVQRRATKIVPYIRDLPYEERLKKLDILSLEERRVRGDLIQYFKFYKGFNKVNWFHTMIPLHSLSTDGPAGATRGGNHRLVKQLTKLDSRANFLSNRVVNEWNKLPTEVVESKSVNQFKNRLDKFKGH
jgi:hypothetical protein